jgi:NitT/TauT family transport system permease protein
MTMDASAVSPSTRSSYAAPMVGFGSFIAFVLLIEALIRVGTLNRFIIPLPSEIIASFGRLFVEEDIIRRFFFTAGECFAAGVMVTVCGVIIGVAMQRFSLLQRACETWVAAFASAPLVLTYPLFMVIFGRNALTIIMMGFLAALPPVILKTIEGISGTRKVLVNVGRSFKLTAMQQFWKILFPAALPTIFVGVRLGLIFALINIVGTEFLINFGGLGQLINDLAERYDLAGTYAAICFVILASVLFFMALEKAERWLRPVD